MRTWSDYYIDSVLDENRLAYDWRFASDMAHEIQRLHPGMVVTREFHVTDPDYASALAKRAYERGFYTVSDELNVYTLEAAPEPYKYTPLEREDDVAHGAMDDLQFASTESESSWCATPEAIIQTAMPIAMPFVGEDVRNAIGIANRVRSASSLQNAIISEASRPLFGAIAQSVAKRAFFASGGSVFVAALSAALAVKLTKQWVLKPILNSFRRGIGMNDIYENIERISHIQAPYPENAWIFRGMSQREIDGYFERKAQRELAAALAEAERVERALAEAAIAKQEATQLRATQDALALVANLTAHNYCVGRDGTIFVPVEHLTPAFRASLGNLPVVAT